MAAFQTLLGLGRVQAYGLQQDTRGRRFTQAIAVC